jgi:hypothetical protein
MSCEGWQSIERTWGTHNPFSRYLPHGKGRAVGDWLAPFCSIQERFEICQKLNFLTTGISVVQFSSATSNHYNTMTISMETI